MARVKTADTVSTSPRILLWDIETAKMLLQMEVYQLKQYSTYLPHGSIVRDVWMPCVAWKWLGENVVGSVSVLKDKKRFKAKYWDDYLVVKTMHELISQADILVAHNGDNFDWKMFNMRCVSHGLEPAAKPLMIDTMKIAKREFRFASNSLAYIAKFLGVEDKGNSPDWGLIAKGDRDAIKYCVRYCRQDIRTLEGVFLKLRPYATNLPNINAILRGVYHDICPKCGHWDLERRGFTYTRAAKYQRVQCKPITGGCGGWSQDKKNLKTVALR